MEDESTVAAPSTVINVAAKEADATKEAAAAALRLFPSVVNPAATDAEKRESTPPPLPDIYGREFQSVTPSPIFTLSVSISAPDSPR